MNEMDEFLSCMQRTLGETEFELSRCTDTYRLNTILNNLLTKLKPLAYYVSEAVDELERM